MNNKMKMNSEDLRKIKQFFTSPAIKNIIIWSKCIRGRILLICLMNIISVFGSLGMTLVTKELIDAAVSFHADMLWKYGVCLLVIALIEIGLGFGLSLTRTKASAKLQHSMQSMLVREILDKEYSSLKGYHSGELVNRVFSDSGVIRSGVLSILPGIISMMVSFIGAATILIVLDWRFVVLLTAAGLIGVIIVLLFRKPMKTRHKRMQEAGDKLHSVIQESIENIRLIKASISEKRIIKQVNERQDNMEKEQIRQGKFSALMNNSMGLMFEFSWLFCMLWGSNAIYRGELTYGSLAAMIQLIGRVQGPIASAVSIAGEAYRVISSAERIMELTQLPAENNGEALNDFDEINVDQVTFRYEESADDVLRNISCTIRKGDFVALTGISGGGKTSLFHLLLGIYAPQSGEIIFRKGEKQIKACRGTRNLFAYVPQGNTLFSGTLKDNLTMFTDHSTEEAITEAIKAACIDDVVDEIGLDAELGERGTGLSEGQAQRVAVARALLTGAPILLLDESTSALDEETEAKMLANISKMRDKTCLIVTHRKAALSICDYRLQIADGKMTRESALSPE